MITVNGYRAFKGVMKIYNEFGDEVEIEGSWLYRPDTGNWFHQETGDRYRSDYCEVVEDYTK
jgi:hypothetical protein